ncbi:hypothetical protein [Sulfitobacter sp.]|uniref:hypothetical protein n=1 Tax=Sulfitobacter sp. TaxID=1903071 RepID=UPI0025D0F851|nr:hypothetical protein [Sulfitobacter sp.]
MNFAIIESGKVANLAVADEPLAENWIEAGAAQIGWHYDGENFTPPPPEPDPVPDAVSMRQARLALSRNGLLADAEAAIAGMTGPEGDEARIEWEYATELRRDHPLVAALGQTLGLDDAAKDDLFRQAAQIL